MSSGTGVIAFILNRISVSIRASAVIKLPSGRAATRSNSDRVSCDQGSHGGVAYCRTRMAANRSSEQANEGRADEKADESWIY
jgi:hypothetical protein